MKVATLWEEHFAPWGRLMRPSWRGTQGGHWVHLKKHFGNIEVEKLTEAHLAAYRFKRSQQVSQHHGKPITASTRNREVHSLTACLRWAKKSGLIAVHPLRGVDSESEKGRRHRLCMTAEMCRRLHDELVAQGELVAAAIVTFTFETGLRPKETMALTWKNVTYSENRPVLVTVVQSKNGEERLVPLRPGAQAAVEAQNRGDRKVFMIRAITLNRRIRAAVASAGLPDDLQLYGARHGCGTELRRAGVPHWTIMRWLGHRDERSARIYQHFDTSDLLAAAAKVAGATNPGAR